MIKNSIHTVRGDRALRGCDEDKLGFREVAKRISTSLNDRASEDGLVVGVEGAWGSGKSSLLFLIGEELQHQDGSKRPTVINFRPWLVGNRDALITSLFGELSNQLDSVASDAGDLSPAQRKKAKAAGVALRRFVGGLSATGAMIEVVGEASGFAPAKWAGKGVKALADMAKGKPTPPQLSELKDQLSNALKELGHRFIITIDDVDRLEPAEVIEVLRLVRSVVDLPNVIYLLCYDGKILAQGIEKAAGVLSGKDFLEKIVQLTIMVPKPEPLQLRKWFSDELQKIASTKNDDELSRLKLVIDYEGGRQLKTPRSVVRALDAIRFFWPPLTEVGADLADLVWLQLIKDGNPKLYRWIEDYTATAAALSLGIASIEEAARSDELRKLMDVVPENHFKDLMYCHYFKEQLPGVEQDYAEDSVGLTIFGKTSTKEQNEAIDGKRLSSPDHYRLYFALAGPSHELTQSNVSSLLNAAAESPEEAGVALLRLNEENVSPSGALTKADVLLERMQDGATENLSSQQCRNILLAFSKILDEAAQPNGRKSDWLNSLSDRARRLIQPLMAIIEPEGRTELITEMFTSGQAIGWLTSLFRHETFKHGLYGDKPSHEEERLFTAEQFKDITEIMLSRYRGMSSEEVFGCPKPISLLYAWLQGGDENGVRQFVASIIGTDEGFLRALENLTTTINSSNRGSYLVLKKENLDSFMDHDLSMQRLQSLEGDTLLGKTAARLMVYANDANKF